MSQDLEEDYVKHMARYPTYSYLLLLRSLTNFSINLYMERRRDLLYFFKKEHSITAMGLSFFVQSLPVCLDVFERLSFGPIVWTITTTRVQTRTKHTGNYWTKNKNPIAIMLCSIEKNERWLCLFSIDKFMEKFGKRTKE